MNKILKNILIVTMILSLLANVVLFVSIGVIEMEWENIYETNIIQSCELFNDYSTAINNLVTELTIYTDSYDDFEYLLMLDCWNVED